MFTEAASAGCSYFLFLSQDISMMQWLADLIPAHLAHIIYILYVFYCCTTTVYVVIMTIFENLLKIEKEG